jgi:uncharacterized SAM-binding protein YcdF (DUF218 family)
MDTLYSFQKSLLDPVILIVFLLAAGTLSVLARRKRGAALFLVPALVILYGLSLSPVAGALCRYLEKDYITAGPVQPGGLDVVVVLGGGVVETAETGETLLSQPSASRLLRAVQVFRESGAANLLCAGKGVGRKSEAEIMARAAEGLGVPREMLLVDPISENTRGHAIEMDSRFSDKNLRIGLVTSGYHLKRSETEFRKYFHNVKLFSSEFLYSHQKGPMLLAFIPNTGSLFKSAVALREMTGILWYRLKRS